MSLDVTQHLVVVLGLVAAEHAGLIVNSVLLYDHPLLPGPSQPPALVIISSPDQSEMSEQISTNHNSSGHNTQLLDQSEASIVASCQPIVAHLAHGSQVSSSSCQVLIMSSSLLLVMSVQFPL